MTLITDAWLFQHVVPNVRCQYPSNDRLCRVLVLSLLYICLRNNEDVIIQDALCNQVKAVYAAFGLEEEEPVKVVQLHVYRLPNGTFDISNMVPTRDPTAGPQGPGALITAKMGQTLLVRVGAVKQQLVQINLDVMNEQSKGRAETQKLWRVTDNNM